MKEKKIKKGKSGKCLSCVLTVLGALVLLDGILAACLSGFHTGILLTLLLGAVLVAVGILYRRMPRWFKTVFFVLLGLGILVITFLPVYGARDTVTHDEDVLIVLGSSIRGDKPSPTLVKRLDVAYAYAVKNPDALIVVSGGKGEGESVAESSAMKRYLTEKGIDGERIIEESLSTSTKENLANSKVILEELGVVHDRVALVTSDYHILRAEAVAENDGFGDVTHCSAATPFLYVLPAYLRECAAILAYAIF